MASRKDYELVAAALKATLEQDSRNWSAVAFMAGRLIVDFEADNPRFDSERFVKATGLAG